MIQKFPMSVFALLPLMLIQGCDRRTIRSWNSADEAERFRWKTTKVFALEATRFDYLQDTTLNPIPIEKTYTRLDTNGNPVYREYFRRSIPSEDTVALEQRSNDSLRYDNKGRLVERIITDQGRIHRLQTRHSNTYDNSGNLIEEVQCLLPIGMTLLDRDTVEKTLYGYDQTNNLIEKRVFKKYKFKDKIGFSDTTLSLELHERYEYLSPFVQTVHQVFPHRDQEIRRALFHPEGDGYSEGTWSVNQKRYNSRCFLTEAIDGYGSKKIEYVFDQRGNPTESIRRSNDWKKIDCEKYRYSYRD